MFTRIRVFAFAFLIALAFSFSFYVVKIHEVASHVIDFEDGFYWPSTGYSLFPKAYTPKDWSGFRFLQVLTPLTTIEIFIIRQLVETPLLILTAFSLWIVSGIFGIYIYRNLKDIVEKRFTLTVTLFVVGVSCIVTSFFITSSILSIAGLIFSVLVGLMAIFLRKHVFPKRSN